MNAMNVTLEYWNGKEFVNCGDFFSEQIAWISLGGDDINYRTIDKNTKKVLTSKVIVKPSNK